MELEYRDRQGESENAPQRRGEGLAPPNVAVNRSQREGGGFAADAVQTVTLDKTGDLQKSFLDLTQHHQSLFLFCFYILPDFFFFGAVSFTRVWV